MPFTLTVLCENSVFRPGDLVGEHGFACLVEHETAGRYLFDTGRGLGLAGNSRLLGKNLAHLDGIILSHGHADHAGGLPDALTLSGPTPVLLHPGAFRPRCWAGRHETRGNGMPRTREELANRGARFREVTDFTELGGGCYLSGEVPRVTDFETGDPHLFVHGPKGELLPDPFPDDLSLALKTERGLVVLVGCAHAGLANILLHFRRRMQGERIHAVIGGTHLAPAEDRQFRATVRLLEELDVKRIGLSHCTGPARGAELARDLPGRVFFANVGWSCRFNHC